MSTRAEQFIEQRDLKSRLRNSLAIGRVETKTTLRNGDTESAVAVAQEFLTHFETVVTAPRRGIFRVMQYAKLGTLARSICNIAYETVSLPDNSHSVEVAEAVWNFQDVRSPAELVSLADLMAKDITDGNFVCPEAN